MATCLVFPLLSKRTCGSNLSECYKAGGTYQSKGEVRLQRATEDSQDSQGGGPHGPLTAGCQSPAGKDGVMHAPGSTVY